MKKHKRRRSKLSLRDFSICTLNLAARRGFLAAESYSDYTEYGCRGGGGSGQPENSYAMPLAQHRSRRGLLSRNLKLIVLSQTHEI